MPVENSAGLLRSPEDTIVGIEQWASFLQHLPFFMEDNHAMSPREKRRDVIMMLANGAGKARGREDGMGLRPSKQWKTVTIITGEAAVSECTNFRGVAARVLSFPPPLPEADNDPDVLLEIEEIDCNHVRHYGHAGRAWISHLVHKGGVREVLEAYEHWLPIMRRASPLNGVAQRWSKCFAVILAAAQVASPVIGGRDILNDLLEVAVDHLGKRQPEDSATHALNLLVGWIAVEPSGNVVGSDEYRKKWFKRQDDAWLIETNELRRRLFAEGISFDGVKKEWFNRGWMAYKGEPKTRVRQRLGTDKVNAWCTPVQARLIEAGVGRHKEVFERELH
jgi:hypothetical protein